MYEKGQSSHKRKVCIWLGKKIILTIRPQPWCLVYRTLDRQQRWKPWLQCILVYWGYSGEISMFASTVDSICCYFCCENLWCSGSNLNSQFSTGNLISGPRVTVSVSRKMFSTKSLKWQTTWNNSCPGNYYCRVIPRLKEFENFVVLTFAGVPRCCSIYVCGPDSICMQTDERN